MDLVGAIDPEELKFALEAIKKEIIANGDVAHIVRSGNDFTLKVQYSLIDYKKPNLHSSKSRMVWLSLLRALTAT